MPPFIKAITLIVAALLASGVACADGIYNPGGLSGGVVTAYPINVASFLSPTQLSAVQGGANTTDVSGAISNAIAACPNTGCAIYFPAGYYYDASCNHTLSKPFSLKGDHGRSLDGTQNLSVIACGNNGVPLFTSTAKEGLFRDFGCVSVGFTPTAGSSCIVNTGSTGKEQVDWENLTVDGFFIGIDVQVGQSWHGINSTVLNAVSIGLSIQNTVIPDAGGCWVENVQFNMAPLALAGIKITSAGGCALLGNNIISQTSTPIVDGIVVDFTGVVTQQIIIEDNSVDFVSNFALNVIKGVNYTTLHGNYFGCGHSSATSCVSLTGFSFSNIGPNTFKFASQTASYSCATAQNLIFLPQAVNGLPVSFGSGCNASLGDLDMTTFAPAVNLFLGPVDPRIPGAAVAVDAINEAHCSEFQVNVQVTITAVEWVVGVQSGNVSLGIFNQTSHAWVATTGSVATPAAGVRDTNLTGSLTLTPGTKYYGCIAFDNTTATFLALTQTASPNSIDALNMKVDSKFPIPASGALGTSHTATKAPVLQFF